MKRLIMPALLALLAAFCIFQFLEIRALQSRIETLEEKGVTVVTEHVPEAVTETDIRAQFSTLDEVRTYFDELFPELWMSAHAMDNEGNCWLSSGEEIMQRQAMEAVGRSCVANAATWLLGDDMEIYTLIGFRSTNGAGDPLWAMNCFKTDDGYEIIDPVLGMRGDAVSRFGAMLPEATVGSLADYAALLREDGAIMQSLDSLWLFGGGETIEFSENARGVVSVKSSHGTLIFENEEKAAAEAAAMAHIKPENIGNYALSGLLGGVTLSAEEAYALLDAEPEAVRERVKTAADLLLYMLAAQTGDCHGCYCDEWDGYVWHTNLTAKDVMEQRLGNCGSCANLANYLLDGDYEEVGFINHAYYFGQGGGHVYNYILHEGQYYIVDYSSYIFSNYQDHEIPVLSRLEDFDANAVYGSVSLVIAYDTPGQHLPNIFGEDMGDPHYYVPQGAEYTVLYEAGDGYLIGEMPLDKKYHDYKVYWEK